eukprot:7705-Heterococcus_DN1.PRE.3
MLCTRASSLSMSCPQAALFGPVIAATVNNGCFEVRSIDKSMYKAERRCWQLGTTQWSGGVRALDKCCAASMLWSCITSATMHCAHTVAYTNKGVRASELTAPLLHSYTVQRWSHSAHVARTAAVRSSNSSTEQFDIGVTRINFARVQKLLLKLALEMTAV